MSLQSRLQSARPEDQRDNPQETQRDFSGPSTAAPGSADPFGELKTRIHHDIITRIGPRLFNATSDDHELSERVGEAVAEALALDKTPLTRQERAQVTREITDDILGYGPLEPFLRDDTITEVMVNNYHTIFIERRGKITATNAQFARRPAPAAHHRQDHQPQSAAASTRPRRWSTRACPTARA